jgi:hypothetical protein
MATGALLVSGTLTPYSSNSTIYIAASGTTWTQVSGVSSVYIQLFVNGVFYTETILSYSNTNTYYNFSFSTFITAPAGAQNIALYAYINGTQNIWVSNVSLLALELKR